MLGLPFLETAPFQFGNLFDETLHLLVVTDGLAHALLPRFGDANLAQFAGTTLHQVHRPMLLAVGAMAVGFAALAGAIGQSAAKKPLAGGELGNAGAETALRSGEFGADEGLGHVLCYISYKIRTESKGKNTIRICCSGNQCKNNSGIRCFSRPKILVCGIAGDALNYWQIPRAEASMTVTRG